MMLNAVMSFDAICLQLRSSVEQLNSPLREEVLKLSADVGAIITSQHPVRPALDRTLPRIFDLRVKALRWMLNDGDPLDGIMEVQRRIGDMGSDPALRVLVDNILRALVYNARVLTGLMTKGGLSGSVLTEKFSQLPEVTYEDFLSSMRLLPDERVAVRMIDWMHASLRIEVVVLATGLIGYEKLTVPMPVIDELTEIIADATDAYAIVATELGLLQPSIEGETNVQRGRGQSRPPLKLKSFPWAGTDAHNTYRRDDIYGDDGR